MIETMRQWTVRALLALAALVAVFVAIGALLPRAHVASARVTLRQPTAAVWHAITDVEAFPSWRQDVTTVERRPAQEGRAVWVEVGPQGRLPLEVVEAVEPSRLVLRIADPDLPFGGTWTYEIASADTGCTLTITERGEIRNPVFRFMARVIFGYHATIEGYLTSLGRKFGEAVSPVRVAT
jgi:uncharacterized protein YndB with AHSA1/START domain